MKGLFVIVSLLAITAIGCNSSESNGFQNLAQTELNDLLSQSDVIMVDVRSPEEVSNGFIPKTSKFINFYDDTFETSVQELDKSKTYVLYCAAGVRSDKASQIMINNGFKKVFSLEGGISDYTGELATDH